MLTAFLAIAVLLTAAPAAQPPAVPDLAPWAETIHALFGEAGVVEAVCGAGIRERLTKVEEDVVICGDSELSFQSFQQIWRRSITKLNKQGRDIQSVSEWELDEGIYTRTYRSAAIVFGLIFTQGHAIVFNASPGKKEPPPAQRREVPIGPYETGTEGLINPVLLKPVKPYYPDLPRKAGIEAHVVLTGIVKLDGTVANVRVISCTAPDLGFEEATETALRQWTYEPGTLRGQPVEVFWEVTVDFTIN